MSWFAKNFEKAALGGAAVVAIGLAYLGWSKIGGVDDDFANNLTGSGKGSPAVANAERIPKAIQSLALDRTWTPAVDGERPVDLFTGIPLFIRSTEPDIAVDLLKDDPIHPPIPNTWWIEHRIDPGYSDSPERDPDGDGFSNLEEFLAGTDPNDPRSFPALLAKLQYVKDESLAWALRPGFGADGAFPFNYRDSQGRVNRAPAGSMVKPGELFFSTEPMANRFKLLGHEVREERNERLNIDVEVTYARIEDQRENKKGKVYEVPAPLAENRMNDFLQYDRSAVFTLEALGLEGREFTVEENTPFALPPDADSKDYHLKEVTPEKVVVEGPDGKGGRTTVEIPKGSVPTLDP